MSHRKAMTHIRQASWPLVLRFRLPLEERDVFSLSKIAEMRCAAVAPLTVRRRAMRECSLEQGRKDTWYGSALENMRPDFLSERAFVTPSFWPSSPPVSFSDPGLLFPSRSTHHGKTDCTFPSHGSQSRGPDVLA